MESNGNENHSENIDYPNELNLLQISDQTGSENLSSGLDKSKYSTENNGPDNHDFDHVNIQNKINGVIHDIRSPSSNNTSIPRHSTTSNQLHQDQKNSSSLMIDPSRQADLLTNNSSEDLVQSMSESPRIEDHVFTESSIPIRQDESSVDNEDLYGIQPAPMHMSTHTDKSMDQYQSDQENHKNNPIVDNDDDDDFFNTKTGTIADKQQSPSLTKPHDLDATIHSDPTSSSQVPSATTKQLTHATSNESLKSVDEKYTRRSSSNLSNDAKGDHQKVENVVISSSNRPRTPTSYDSHKSSVPLIKDDDGSIHFQINDNDTTNLSNGSERNDEHVRNQNVQLSDDINLSVSRSESANEKDQQQISQRSQTHKHHLKVLEESSKLFPAAEQLGIPTKGFNNERINSPPPLPAMGIKSLILLNPLLESHFIEEEQNQSRPSSGTSRKSSTISMISNEKIIDGEILSPKSRRESNISQSQITHQKSPNQPETTISDRERLNRQESTVRDQQLPNTRESPTPEQQISNRRASHSSKQPSSDCRRSLSDQDEQKLASRPNSRRINSADQQRIPSCRTSPNLVNPSSSFHPSNVVDNSPSKDSTAVLTNKDSRRSSVNTIDKSQSSLQRCSKQQSKRNSNVITDETVVTPIITDSVKTRPPSGKRSSATESDLENKSSSKLPSINSSFQQGKSHRSEIKRVSSSLLLATPTENEQTADWIKQTIVPNINFTNDEQSLTVEHHQTANEHKGKEQRLVSRRSRSINSSPQIRPVDDKSLDSSSENNTDFDRHNRCNIKSKKKDFQTNAEQIFNSSQQQHNIHDKAELTSQKPLKATKPMSDHLHTTSRRALNRESRLTTSDKHTPIVQCTVKEPKNSNQDKDPVNVNITIVVKKNATDETTIEEKPQRDFRSRQHSSATMNKKKPNERSKSNEQKQIEFYDNPSHHTQSDSENIITKKQNSHRQAKRTSRTHECVFRRLDRSRTTSNAEKSTHTRKLQFRSRNQSPKKLFPPYLSANSFRIKEMLRKQYYQSRRHFSKSSSLPRSLPPQHGKLLILRPTLPFHHSDAVSVQRVCLRYAIDLIPHRTLSPYRQHQPIVQKQRNVFPITNATSAYSPKKKSNTKERSLSRKTSGHAEQHEVD